MSNVTFTGTLADGGVGPKNGRPRLFVNNASLVVDGIRYTFPRGTMVYREEAKTPKSEGLSVGQTVKAASESPSVVAAVAATSKRRATTPTADAPPADLDGRIAAAVEAALSRLLK